ncbi:MAG: hypothetical protein WD696_17005 [Bryobacteraceae bacterium]
MSVRNQFQKHPITMVGAAFGGGLMLSMMIGKNGSRRRTRSSYEWSGQEERSRESSYTKGATQPSRAMSYQRRRAGEMWDNMKGALIGVSAFNVQRFLETVIPGFREEYQKTEQAKRRGMGTSEMPLTSGGGATL